MVEPYVSDVKHAAKQNTHFRAVLFTGATSQLVLMSLMPGEEIGTEVHQADQILYAVDGEGVSILDGSRRPLKKGGVVCVPAGVEHNIINTDAEPMKLFTVYAPPQHAPGTVHPTKADSLHEDAKTLQPAIAASPRGTSDLGAKWPWSEFDSSGRLVT